MGSAPRPKKFLRVQSLDETCVPAVVLSQAPSANAKVANTNSNQPKESPVNSNVVIKSSAPSQSRQISISYSSMPTFKDTESFFNKAIEETSDDNDKDLRTNLTRFDLELCDSQKDLSGSPSSNQYENSEIAIDCSIDQNEDNNNTDDTKRSSIDRNSTSFVNKRSRSTINLEKLKKLNPFKRATKSKKAN